MDFKTYQEKAKETAIYPKINKGFEYPAMGLAGEVGEVLNILKKVHRDDCEISYDYLAKEIGDVLWYVAQLSTELGLDLNEIAKANLKKLKSRKERDVLEGSGDNR